MGTSLAYLLILLKTGTESATYYSIFKTFGNQFFKTKDGKSLALEWER